MKKYSYLIIIVLISSLVLAGCSLLSNISQVPTTEQSGISYLTKHAEGDPFTTDLIAGGGNPVSAIDVGDVLVWNDGDTLYIKYVITDLDWCLIETHLQVASSLAGIPQTKRGNPIPGKFEENDEHDCVPEVLYMYNLADRGWSFENVLLIAVHAVVQKQIGTDEYGPIYQTETGWGAGLDFDGKNWATYFEYTVQGWWDLTGTYIWRFLYTGSPAGTFPPIPYDHDMDVTIHQWYTTGDFVGEGGYPAGGFLFSDVGNDR